MRVSRAADAINLLNAGILRRAPMHRAINTVVNHFPVAGICPHCAVQARLSDDEQQWLEQLRTPATENVISWLADGNAEQFMHGEGCAACAETGYAQPLSVFKLLHRDEKTNQFPTPASSNPGAKSNQANADGTGTLQRQLMGLAKSGKTTISEVIRVLESE